MHDIARYYPIVTAIFSFVVVREMYLHYLRAKETYLLWWMIGVTTFGLAALAASANVLMGWHPAILKFWYIDGALLAGFSLAQGSVYLLTARRFADISAIFFLTVIAVASVMVILTPISLPPNFNNELTGKVFAWKWVRYFSPIVNLYGFLFLVGGGIFSAHRYNTQLNKDERLKGNIYVSLGGILPGIVGSLMRMDYVNVLFVTELIALVVIYSGYRIIKKDTLESEQGILK